MAVRFIPGRPRRGGRIVLPVAVLGLALVIALPELLLQAADHGLIGSARWRPLAYQYGAFWSGLLGNWRPNYPAQPWTMFLSYTVLHAGAGHLAGNLVTLVVLGGRVVERFGSWRFGAICLVSAVGGAVAFGLLAPLSPQPMVGASGALFGLAGALVADEFRLRQREQAPLWPVAALVLVLVALNLAFWIGSDGLLAWQTHLGGFLAGAAAAQVLARS